MFLDEEKIGQIELFNVLKAYSIYNPKVGFCQAQAPIAAFLLMHMPAEQAFWCFVSVCDKWVSFIALFLSFRFGKTSFLSLVQNLFKINTGELIKKLCRSGAESYVVCLLQGNLLENKIVNL